MVRLDEDKIQEIKDRHQEIAKREIARAINDPDTEELKDDDIQAIHNKHQYQANLQIDKIQRINPEKLHKSGLAESSNGWREGYTKSLIKDRVDKRRTKTKLGKLTRKQQRRK